MKQYIETKHWSVESVRRACIRNDLFTAGDCEEYDHMLNWVTRLYPNTENIQYIAEIIDKYSEGQEVSNIMYILANEAVITTYEVA